MCSKILFFCLIFSAELVFQVPAENETDNAAAVNITSAPEARPDSTANSTTNTILPTIIATTMKHPILSSTANATESTINATESTAVATDPVTNMILTLSPNGTTIPGKNGVHSMYGKHFKTT